MSTDQSLWKIHAGRIGEADTLFLKQKATITEDEIGDVTQKLDLHS